MQLAARSARARQRAATARERASSPSATPSAGGCSSWCRSCARSPATHAAAAGRELHRLLATEAEAIVFVVVASEKTALRAATVLVSDRRQRRVQVATSASATRSDAERELAWRGYDTWLGRATAYSTLGLLSRSGHDLDDARGRSGSSRCCCTRWRTRGCTSPVRPTGTSSSRASSACAAPSSTSARAMADDAALHGRAAQHLARRERSTAVTARPSTSSSALRAAACRRPQVLRERERVFARVASGARAAVPGGRARGELWSTTPACCSTGAIGAGDERARAAVGAGAGQLGTLLAAVRALRRRSE